MSEQLQLIQAKTHGVSPSDVSLLLRILSGRDWLTAKEILALVLEETGDAKKWSERHVRAVASSSDGRVISYPGSPGYKLTRESMVSEIQTAAGVLRHQANQMVDRAVQIDRVYHGKL